MWRKSPKDFVMISSQHLCQKRNITKLTVTPLEPYMKLSTIFILATATLLPAQSPGKTKPAALKPQPVAAPVAPAIGHATLAALQRDFQEKKFAAIDAYVKAHGDAKDAGDAIFEAADLAKTLGRNDGALRFADLYLKQFPDGAYAGQMRMARAVALRSSGDVAGAQKTLEAIIEQSGDNVSDLVAAVTTLADMLVENGKKDEAIELIGVCVASHGTVRGLKEHLNGMVKNYELIGTEPTAIGQNDTTGKPIDLAAYKGKVVLLDFWATWCGPCIGELPNVLAAYEKFHGKGFEIVGISLDEDRAAFDKFIVDRKMTWRHQCDGKGWKNEVAVAYGVQSIPATYLIGVDGKIVAMGLRGEQLAQRLAKLLEAPAKPAK